jgi:glycosyltransferase involved in cell wall biosynthesis
MILPKISVIVPVYNNEKYLQKTVESILNQTYKNIEIILVDDGSVDESPRICDEMAEDYENIVAIHQKNKGVSSARNAGLKKATGELIAFCDGDDILQEDMYELLHKQMTEENSDIACCSSSLIMENNTVLNKLSGKKLVWESCDDYLRDFLVGRLSMSACTKLFKSEILHDVAFPEDCTLNEDKFFCFLSALNTERISFQDVGKYLYFRRKGSSSITDFSEKYFDVIKLAQRILEIIKEKKPHLSEEAECNLLLSSLRVYKLIYIRNGLGGYKKEAKLLREYFKGFDKKRAKKYISTKDYIRFVTARTGKMAFKLLTAFFDKN